MKSKQNLGIDRSGDSVFEMAFLNNKNSFNLIVEKKLEGKNGMGKCSQNKLAISEFFN